MGTVAVSGQEESKTLYIQEKCNRAVNKNPNLSAGECGTERCLKFRFKILILGYIILHGKLIKSQTPRFEVSAKTYMACSASGEGTAGGG